MTMARKGSLALAVPIMLLLTSCGERDGSGSSDTAAVAESDSLTVTWDGTDCVYEGPAEVRAGAVTVDLVNNGDDVTNLIVFKLDDGITAQDMIDEFGTEPRTSLSSPLGSTDMGKAAAPADPGETQQWERDLATGEYVLLCIRNRGQQWFGSGLTVVDG